MKRYIECEFTSGRSSVFYQVVDDDKKSLTFGQVLENRDSEGNTVDMSGVYESKVVKEHVTPPFVKPDKVDNANN
jgi:hypothetical protein